MQIELGLAFNIYELLSPFLSIEAPNSIHHYLRLSFDSNKNKRALFINNLLLLSDQVFKNKLL